MSNSLGADFFVVYPEYRAISPRITGGRVDISKSQYGQRNNAVFLDFRESGQIKFFDSGVELLSVPSNSVENIFKAADCFCAYVGCNFPPAKRQLRDLVNEFVLGNQTTTTTTMI
jgi:hypothetical protein